MKVRMRTQISGSRNGVRWPKPGGEVELPDAEGARMCERGFAEPVAEKADDKAETATPRKRSEKR